VDAMHHSSGAAFWRPARRILGHGWHAFAAVRLVEAIAFSIVRVRGKCGHSRKAGGFWLARVAVVGGGRPARRRKSLRFYLPSWGEH